MVSYVVKKTVLKSNGQYFHRGDIVSKEQIRDIGIKVGDGSVVKIDLATPAGQRKLAGFERRMGLRLRGKILAHQAESEALEILTDEENNQEINLEDFQEDEIETDAAETEQAVVPEKEVIEVPVDLTEPTVVPIAKPLKQKPLGVKKPAAK